VIAEHAVALPQEPAGLRRVSAVVRAKGIVLVALGAVHTAGLVFSVAPDAFAHLAIQWATWYSTWFGLAGVLFAFMGVVDLLSFAGLRRGERGAWRLALASSALATGVGPLGTCLMLHFRDVGAVFPATIFLVGAVSLPALLGTRRLTA
jgi:hypothetical protein